MRRVLGLALVIFAFSTKTLAAVAIDPTAIKVTLEAGEIYNTELTLTNQGAQEVELTVEPEYWYQGECPDLLNNWLKISPARVKIPGQGQRKLKVKINPPDNIKGECMVMLFLARQPFGSGILIQPRTGIPIYLRQAGTERLKAGITDFRLMPGLAGEKGLVFSFEVHNQGNAHLVPFGVIVLKCRQSKKVYEQDFKFAAPIFAGKSQSMIVKFEKEIPANIYQAEVKAFLDNLYNREKPDADLKVISRHCNVMVE
ncbi:hypothetical protein KAR10_05250 [bacterium]|nr:hypothetical protein [bacterium]